MTDFLTDLGRELKRAGERLDEGGGERRFRGPLAALAAAATIAIGMVVAIEDPPERERTVPAATPTPKPTREERLDRIYSASVDSVIARADAYLDVPVAAPAALPPGTLANRDIRRSALGGERRVQLGFRTPDGGIITLLLGTGGFDGCGPSEEPKVVDINGARGLLNAGTLMLGHGKPKRPFTTVVWPVKPGEHDGTYALSGILTGPEALRLARSMDVTKESRSRPDDGC